jgi:hypothetical protein
MNRVFCYCKAHVNNCILQYVCSKLELLNEVANAILKFTGGDFRDLSDLLSTAMPM